MEKICLQIHVQLVFSVEVFEGIEMVKQWVYYLLLKLFPKMMASSLLNPSPGPSFVKFVISTPPATVCQGCSDP